MENQAEKPIQGHSIDPLPFQKEHVDTGWLAEHLNMGIALQAYEKAVAEPQFGPTRIESHITPEKMALIQEKVSVEHLEGAAFPLNDEELQQALCLFPESWLKLARLKGITVRPPAMFVCKDYDGDAFICGIEEERNGQKYFTGRTTEEVTPGFYESRGLIPPTSPFHYAPGQYRNVEEDILLFQEPEKVRKAISLDARRQYGRELVVHEFLHSVLREDANIQFMIDGVPRDYVSLMREFYEICQSEPASTSEYSELYQPWLRLEFDLKSSHVVKMALQEEMGELLSSYLLGWGCTPRGAAMKITDRDFAGCAYHERGKSEKVAFAERLLRSTAFVGEDPVSSTREEIAEKLDVASDSNSPKNDA